MHSLCHKIRLIVLGLCVLSSIIDGPAGTAQLPSSSMRTKRSSFATKYAGNDNGPLDPSSSLPRMRLVLARNMQKSNALTLLLNEQRDRGSQNYRQWITPQAFGSRFGASDDDVKQITDWLTTNDLLDVQVSPAKDIISFTGSVSKVQKAFATVIHKYKVGDQLYYANVLEPTLPADLARRITAVQGLTNFAANPKPAVLVRKNVSANLSGNTVQGLGPAELAGIYDISPLYQSGILGSHSSIAVVGAASPSITDFNIYKTLFNLPPNDYQLIQVPGSKPGPGTGDTVLEAMLDLELAGAVAPRAQLLYVESDDLIAAVAYVIDNRLSQVISMSYVSCELPSPADAMYQALAIQAAAEGISWINAAGDSGAAACDPPGADTAAGGLAVNLPASVPEITGVGGTSFITPPAINASANASGTTPYVEEAGWNGVESGLTVTASGGGISKDFYKPGFQSSVQDGILFRAVPDVSLAASTGNPGYLVISEGQAEYVGGTSAATPVFAGVSALVNDYLVTNGLVGHSGLGSLNPQLYRLAETAPEVFHDVTTGSNQVTCNEGSLDCAEGLLGYVAGPGYDMVTGLGSIDVDKLATAWTTAVFEPSVTTLSTSNPDSSGDVAVQATVTAPTGPLEGTVVFSWSNESYGPVNNSIARVNVGPDGIAATTFHGLPRGTNLISATFQGTTALLGSVSKPAQVLVNTAQPAMATIQLIDTSESYPAGAAIPLSASVLGNDTQPVGTVSFFLGNMLVGSALVKNGFATTLSSLPLPAGPALLSARYSGDTVYAPVSSTAVPLTVLSAPADTPTNQVSVHLAASATQALAGEPVTLTASLIGLPINSNGTITFYANQVPLGQKLTMSQAAATATYTTIPAGPSLVTAVYDPGASGQMIASSALVVTVEAPTTTADFILTVPPSYALQPGSSGSIPLTISSIGGFAGLVKFTCTGSISGYACMVPSIITTKGTTTANALLEAQLTAFMPAFALLITWGPGRLRRKRYASIAALAGLLVLTGCGLHINSAAAFSNAGSYPLVITATSGSITHTATVTVQIQ